MLYLATQLNNVVSRFSQSCESGTIGTNDLLIKIYIWYQLHNIGARSAYINVSLVSKIGDH